MKEEVAALKAAATQKDREAHQLREALQQLTADVQVSRLEGGARVAGRRTRCRAHATTSGGQAHGSLAKMHTIKILSVWFPAGARRREV